jgi:hypothetical protein
VRTPTYRRLKMLHHRHGAREFGKICQKLLAVTYRLAGFTHVIERGVQGVDVDAGDGRERYATEVKTTQKASVPFQQKDADGLCGRAMDGYVPLLAVLRLGALSDWYLARAESLRPGILLIDVLRPYRLRELERRLQPCFDEAVENHFAGALTGSQAYLDGILQQAGVEVYSTPAREQSATEAGGCGSSPGVVYSTPAREQSATRRDATQRGEGTLDQ